MKILIICKILRLRLSISALLIGLIFNLCQAQAQPIYDPIIINPTVWNGIGIVNVGADPYINFNHSSGIGEIKISGETFLIKKGGNHSLTMTNNGFVGIHNRYTPLEALDVNGAIRIGTAEGAHQGTIRFNGSKFQGCVSNDTWVDFNDVLPHEVFWTKGQGNKVYNTGVNTDMIGIGTNNPSSKLHVSGGEFQITASSSLPDENKSGLTMGENTGIYTWIQSKSGLPLVLNPKASSSDFVAIGFAPINGLNPNGYKLAVYGKIVCDELKVKYPVWPDYVFDSNYNLPKLRDTEEYILKNKHLPELPSAKEVEKDGFETGKMNAMLLKKIEELTLYIIQQGKDIDQLKLDNIELKAQNQCK